MKKSPFADLLSDMFKRTRRVTAEEAEEAHMVSDERLGPEPVPFGFLHEEWKALLAQMVEGDELWLFCSPPEYWEALCGREGVELVRDGKTIALLVTCLN